MPEALSPRGRNPIAFVTVAMALSWAMLIWLGWHSYTSYRKSRTMRQRIFRIEELRGVIVHLDEVLTMSARMAAALLIPFLILGWLAVFRATQSWKTTLTENSRRLVQQATE